MALVMCWPVKYFLPRLCSTLSLLGSGEFASDDEWGKIRGLFEIQEWRGLQHLSYG